MRYLRRVKGIIKMNRIRNITVQEELKIEAVTKKDRKTPTYMVWLLDMNGMRTISEKNIAREDNNKEKVADDLQTHGT